VAAPRSSETRTAIGKRPSSTVWRAAGSAPDEPVIVAIAMAAQLDVIGYTHAFFASYLRQRFLPTIADPLTVASYELLDNGLSYGSVADQVRLELVESSSSVAVRVSNASISARVDMLISHFERLRSSEEPVFVEEMRRTLTGGFARPMLGLARIVYETSLDLQLYVDDLRVTVVARREK
jgi:hypothetical protein